MNALSVIQPWASALFLQLPDGGRLKEIETRSWKPPKNTVYPFRIAIHASKGFPKWAREFYYAEQQVGRISTCTALPLGAIIGFVTVTDVKLTGYLASQISDIEYRYGDYTPSRFGWITDDPELLPAEKIIYCSGSLGLWKVPDELLLQHGIKP